jgi:hypothetical protein
MKVKENIKSSIAATAGIRKFACPLTVEGG